MLNLSEAVRGLRSLSDTLATTEAYLAARYGELSPGQRIEMACGMWTTAVGMARAGLGDAAAGLSETEQRVMLWSGSTPAISPRP